MFLHALTSDQQRLFCQLARHLMLADEVLDAREGELERVILRETGLSDFPSTSRPLPDLLAELRNIGPVAQRNAVFVELVGIALVDDELHPAEAALLESTRRELSVPEETARALMDFGERYHALAREGRLLVFESDAPSDSGEQP